MSNSENEIISVQEFYGGQSSGQAIGPTASFSYSRALDHRSDPSQLTVLPGPRLIGRPNDLILKFIQTQDGTRYGYGDQGYLYKIDTSNVMTFAEKLPVGSDGMLYRKDSDAIYLATSTDLRRYYPISGNPDIDVIHGPSKSIDTNAYRTGGVAEYSVPTTIDETQYCSFQPDIEPFYSIKVNVQLPGSGTWTLTLHDGLNNVLGTVTKANAAVSGATEFVFSSQIRALVKPNARTYHFHLTSSASGGTVACSTAESLNTADFELWAYRLVDTVNGFHPMAEFQQFILIGNERYVAVWEPLTEKNPPNNEFQRHRLVVPPGFEVCGIAASKGFAYIACEKASSNASKDAQEGIIFKWDGSSKTYDDYVEVSSGSPQSIFMYNNFPYFYVNGALHAWPGGDTIVKVRTVADTNTAYRDVVDNTTVYPNMMTVRDNLLHMGYPSSTNNTSIEHGVYVWGSLDKDYAASFNYGYVISSQTNLNTAGTLQLGSVRNFGDEMYISWKDGDSYGLDIVDSLCDPAPVFKFRARRFTAGAAFRNKQALRTAIDTAALPEGITIAPTYQIDNSAEQVQTEHAMGANEVRTVAPISNGVFKRIIVGFDGASSGTTSPVIYSDTLEWNPLIGRKSL
jgi:hypothetical protein